jgi:hypothetical protein
MFEYISVISHIHYSIISVINILWIDCFELEILERLCDYVKHKNSESYFLTHYENLSCGITCYN